MTDLTHRLLQFIGWFLLPLFGILSALFAVVVVAWLVAVWISMPASAHSWYTGKTNPVTGASCCNLTDCWAVEVGQVRSVGAGYTVTFGGQVYSIDHDQVQPSEDHQFHACIWGGELKCLFVPAGV